MQLCTIRVRTECGDRGLEGGTQSQKSDKILLCTGTASCSFWQRLTCINTKSVESDKSGKAGNTVVFAIVGEHNHRNAMIQPLNWVHCPITKIHHGRYVSARSLQPREISVRKIKIRQLSTTENIQNKKNAQSSKNILKVLARAGRLHRTTCKTIMHMVVGDVTLPTNRKRMSVGKFCDVNEHGNDFCYRFTRIIGSK